MEANTYLPKMYYVEENVLNTYIADNKEFNLYIARSECGDCSTINEEFLRDWSYNHVTTKENLYIFDIQKYYARKGQSTPEELKLYQQIKDRYGLSGTYTDEEGKTIVVNEKFGFSTGAVPTFQHRKGNEIKDMFVPLNDGVGENGKLSSYFTTERVANMAFLKEAAFQTVFDQMELTQAQIDEFYRGKETYKEGYKKEFQRQYHYPIVEQFFKTYID